MFVCWWWQLVKVPPVKLRPSRRGGRVFAWRGDPSLIVIISKQTCTTGTGTTSVCEGCQSIIYMSWLAIKGGTSVNLHIIWGRCKFLNTGIFVWKSHWQILSTILFSDPVCSCFCDLVVWSGVEHTEQPAMLVFWIRPRIRILNPRVRFGIRIRLKIKIDPVNRKK
jgi:hypothetical protein